ncbi:MAG: AAA family ATPase [Candidatus Heimdallarchaeota archaeon]|nr:AAA family ATPase [Candidatus Heimdallarchaeota archaeon]
MQSLVLLPVGYPLRAGEEPAPFLTTDDPTLFQHYARSQWTGLVVRKGHFLFDSLLFPDYAFRAISVNPEESQITKDTKISLFSEQTTEPPIHSAIIDIKFEDVIGQKQAKEKCQIIAKFLSNSDLLNSSWAPKNILFWGPPGNGKTMMAQALSNETSHTILLVKATDLLGIYVGDGARKIRNLYAEARKEAPSLVFIDEIDAIGLKRNFQSIRGDVVELVSALLGELDGIDKNQGVVTIASTNQPQILDSAILNRFEELIEFRLPNNKERKQILEYYASTSPIPFNKIDWNTIVQETQDWSARALKEKIIKNAIHQAVLHERDSITTELIWECLKKSSEITEALPHYS